ncbi:MAG: hypothetical protein P0116_07240 [Candidatus Nitrosocosmicus sp.]|nr:hypothetical protein [Candidatus Nitrosocosmicus sp.]
MLVTEEKIDANRQQNRKMEEDDRVLLHLLEKNMEESLCLNKMDNISRMFEV